MSRAAVEIGGSCGQCIAAGTIGQQCPRCIQLDGVGVEEERTLLCRIGDLGVVAWMLVVLPQLPGGAIAGDLFGWKKPAAAAVPPRPTIPRRPSPAPRPGLIAIRHSAAGNCPWYGYGFGVPTYNWGYFGAAYHPASICTTATTGTIRSGRGGRGIELQQR